MPEFNDTQAIINTAQEATNPAPLDQEGRFFSVVVPNGGSLAIVDLEESRTALLGEPRRKTGLTKTHDAASFIGHFAKHNTDATEVWADESTQDLVAVYNANSALTAGHGDHRNLLSLRKSPAWQAWGGNDRKFLTQTAFAEHVEERLIDFDSPDGATMLELAQSFKATSKGAFESSKRLSSGETTLIYREEHEASAGRKGDIAIPDTFTLALQPFDGGPAYRVNVRLRYRITDGQLHLSYVIERPEDILRNAFAEIVAQVQGGLDGRDIWYGRP